MAVNLRVKRGTRSQLETAKGNSTLAAGEPYLITDETRLAVGTAADAYTSFVREDEISATITASEALSAGNFVNVWNSAGSPRVRKADATSSGKEAHGFVLAAVSNGASAKVFFTGINTGMTSQTAGAVFLSTTAGGATSTAPSSTGNVVQRIGVAVSATAVVFQAGDPVVIG